MKKVYKLEVLEKDNDDGDYTLGVFSTRELAESLYDKYAARQNKLIEKWDKEEGYETSPRFEERYCSYISEITLDDLEWEKW
jgi:hypothetical protein